MEEDERGYSDEDFRRILKKAEELATESDPTSEPGTLLSLSEMKAAASEAGLDPALVERAAHLVPSGSRATMPGRPLHVLGWQPREAAFPTPLTEERATSVLSVLRAAAGQEGRGEATPYGLVWQTDRGRFTVTIRNEGRGSRLEVSADPWRWLALGGWLGILGGGAVIATVEPITAVGLIGGLGVGLGVALGAWAAIASRARKRADALLDAVRQEMQDVAEPLDGSREQIDSGADAGM